MEKLWKISGTRPNSDENPEKILKDHAGQLKKDTDGEFIGIVTETVIEDTGEVIYALYIAVPELRDYMYRLIEVKIKDLVTPYPLEIRLFAQHPKNHRSFLCENVEDFNRRLKEMIESPVTQAILLHLKTLVEIKKAG